MAFVAAHVWLVAVVVQRLCAGAYVRAALWSCILAALITIDMAAVPASAKYDLPQDYLDALPNADDWKAIPGTVAPSPATHCDLFMELQGQVLHVVVKSCLAQFDDRLRINSRTPNCTTHLT